MELISSVIDLLQWCLELWLSVTSTPHTLTPKHHIFSSMASEIASNHGLPSWSWQCPFEMSGLYTKQHPSSLILPHTNFNEQNHFYPFDYKCFNIYCPRIMGVSYFAYPKGILPHACSISRNTSSHGSSSDSISMNETCLYFNPFPKFVNKNPNEHFDLAELTSSIDLSLGQSWPLRSAGF